MKRFYENGIFLRSLYRPSCLGTILYVHGLGESGLCFESLISDSRLLRWSHLVPDLPGYGRSDRPKNPLGLRDYAIWISNLAEEISDVPLVLLGHSMGGVIGLFACQEVPQKFAAFLNVEGNISLEDCTGSSRAAVFSLEEFLSDGFNEIKNWVSREGASSQSFMRYYASLTLCSPVSFYRNSLELVEVSGSEMLAQEQAGIGTINLYIGGLSGGLGQRSQQILSQSGTRWIGIDGAGHWPFQDQPDAFISAVLSFLG